MPSETPGTGSGGGSYQTWYPWYGSGLGYNYGLMSYYYGYDPWYYGSPYSFGRYGLWYNPFGYSPFIYGYASDPYANGRGRDRDEEYLDLTRMGSLRLKAEPKDAKVYIDGALVGTIDDFDGLAGHLSLEAGAHQLEVRAPGYQTFTKDVHVDEGKTRTERITLRRN